MPVEFRPIDPPTTWQMFPRHPAGSDHKDLPNSLAKKMRDGLEKFGVVLRQVVLKREANGLYVLDGWQMYQGCIAAGVKPEFVELVGGIEPDDFVRLKNDIRRHETAQEVSERVRARRKRLQAAVASGISVTRAAKDEGISRVLAHKELAALPPRCQHCERKGDSGDECAACQLLRLDWKPPDYKPKRVLKDTEGRILDANFVVVPEEAEEAFLVAGDIARIGADLGKIAKKLAAIMDDKIGTSAIAPDVPERIADLRQHLMQARAMYVCAYCQGRENAECTACRGQGWQSAAAFAQAPKEMQDAMRKMGARNVPI